MNIPKINLGNKKPTYKKFAQDIDLFATFEKIEQEFKTCFILESLGEEGRYSRYTILGFDPKHILRAKSNTFHFDDKKYSTKNPYKTLSEITPTNTIAKSYAGGLVGYLGYDAINYFEKSLEVKIDQNFDQFIFGVYTDGLILDKLTNEFYYFYFDSDRSEKLKAILKKPLKKDPLKITFIKDSLSKSQHQKIIEQAKEEIRSGNTFQVQIGFKRRYKIKGSVLEIYKRLRELNPSPFMYFIKFGDKKIIGSSPELLFQLQNGEMSTFPLAGTIRRGRTELEDSQLARELLSNEKEIAEHKMLVDLHRNDLGRVAEFGTVKVRSLMDIKRFSHVQHISSEIAGIIKNHIDMFTALASNFPAGTLSGAPKIESMKIIDRLEKEPRGPYGGAVGHFGFNGDCTFAIAIRSLFIDGENGFTQASGGIVYDSEAEKEYDEVQRKLAALTEVLK